MSENPPLQDEQEALRRWRMLLGGGEADGTGLSLGGRDLAMDSALSALYEADRRGGLGSSSPNVARWLGDIRSYFPASVVRLLQQDALERLNLRQMLLEPELLQAVEPDVHLVASLLALKSVIPEKTRDTARQVVRKVVEDVERRLAQPLRQAVQGALDRSARTRRPRYNEMDWPRTIRANLKHYQPEYRTIIPEVRYGFGHKRSSLRHVLLCLDQSGSMAASVVYAGILGSVLASLPALQTRVVAFDTSVVDLTEELHDPVDLLFGVQLGGGTDIGRALSYCQAQITRPQDTVMVLISDLFEGPAREGMLKRAAALIASGVQLIVLLALSDDGAPVYDHRNAAALTGLGAPTFACTPDRFPELIAAALRGQDIALWAAAQGIVVPRGSAD